VLVCLFCAVIFVVVAYLAQMVWPDYSTLPSGVHAVLNISERIGGLTFRWIVFLIMIVAGVSCALAGQVSAARIMYGMGRDGVLPHKFFSYVSKKYRIPSYNLLLIAVVSLALAFLMHYIYGEKAFQIAAQVLNYGAFLGFFAVNLSVIFEYCFRKKPEKFGILEVWRYILMPLIGMIICGIIFFKLEKNVLIYVTGWMVFGLAYYAFITKGFRQIVKMKIEE